MEKKGRYVFGMLVANITDTFSNEAARGAMAAAEQLDINLIVIPGKYICDTSYSNSDTTYEYQYNNLFKYANDKNLDAICACVGTIAYANTDEEKKAFIEQFGSGVPVISIASKIDGQEYVVFDNTQSVRDAVNYLIREEGKTKIACLTGSLSNSDCAERLEGYKLALADNGIAYDESLVCFVNPSRACKDDFESYIKANPDVEAVVCTNDDMCLAVYEVCADLGIQIGDDLLVVGFDDMDYDEKLDPPLASVRASAVDLGYSAVVNAYELLQGREITSRNIPTRFIPRASCGYVGRPVTDVDALISEMTPDRLQKVLYSIYDGTDICHDPVIVKNMGRVFDVLLETEKNGVITEAMAFEIRDALKKMLDYHKEYYMFIKNIQQAADALYHRLKGSVKDDAGKALLEILYLEVYRMLSREVGVQINRASEASIEMLRRSNIVVRDTLMVRRGGGEAFSDLLKRLPVFEINSSFMYLLPEPVSYKKGDRFYDISRWRFVAYSEGDKVVSIKEKDRDIPLSNLFRNGRMPKDRRFTLVMADLYSGEQQFGMLLCELKPQFFEYLEFITYQFGAAVRIISLIGELERHMNKLHHDNEELAGISRADELTGLLNRRGFHQEAQAAVQKGKASGSCAVMVFADLDYLKFINDRYGHDEGDYALKASAALLKRIFRSTDIIGRTGGDEFNILAILGNERNIEQRILARKQKFVDELNAKSGKPYRIDLSMGMCEFCCADVDDLTSVIKSADNKLYEVKRQRKYNPYKNEE
ncbi:MAG: GGDEF domain-containing protein [Ruminococcus sp.]|nr:GGDEF domain-containing protein [Ruminococcus sp.]